VSIEAEERGREALGDILEAIQRYRVAVGDLGFEELATDFIRYHAAERFVEIISEASRRLPQSWKDRFPAIPWADVASIGNVLRHNYSIVDQMVIYGLQHDPFRGLSRWSARCASGTGARAIPLFVRTPEQRRHARSPRANSR
jgi:uncharacterized protein with HEPN domain